MYGHVLLQIHRALQHPVGYGNGHKHIMNERLLDIKSPDLPHSGFMKGSPFPI